jgi:hypothetical protein
MSEATRQAGVETVTGAEMVTGAGLMDGAEMVTGAGLMDGAEMVTGTGLRTATESALAELWRDLLERREFTAEDDFFQAGGTSLAAIKFLQRVEKRFGAEVLSPDALYEDARLGSLAKTIDESQAMTTGESLTKRSDELRVNAADESVGSR